MNKFPQEHIVEFSGSNAYLAGRIIISQTNLGFDSEISIIQSESGKIYAHIGFIYNEEDSKELFNLSIYKLKQHLLKEITSKELIKAKN